MNESIHETHKHQTTSYGNHEKKYYRMQPVHIFLVCKKREGLSAYIKCIYQKIDLSITLLQARVQGGGGPRGLGPPPLEIKKQKKKKKKKGHQNKY